ncbi:MAG: AraC family transcriptional regulator N-terminal domain-containing protein [Gammaproteobacteria bacterium]|nr:AraC family transcriptional regulator N-terminal domain-containing protein [Gammaproteobacteria bacterium]
MRGDNTLLHHRRSNRQLLIENKVAFTGPDSELSIYDTYREASRVGLDAPQLMYCGMVKGKKIMHRNIASDDEGQLFLPHESYVMPPGGHVDIDFPEANERQPTTCLTIEIDTNKIQAISERMNDLTTHEDPDYDWQYQPDVIHAQHTRDTQILLEKMVSLYTLNHPDKEILMELSVSELIIRLLRQQGRDVLLRYCKKAPDTSGITAALFFLEKNLNLPLDIDVLCRQACMSRSKLYSAFKQQLGCSPGEFHQQLRLKNAAQALKSGETVSMACYNAGFNDLSHFSRRFTLFYGCSPTQFRAKYNEPSAD